MAWAADRIGEQGIRRHQNYVQKKVVTFVVLGCVPPRMPLGEPEIVSTTLYPPLPPLFHYDVQFLSVQGETGNRPSLPCEKTFL